MKYTLINAVGKVRVFFVREVAELYRINEGGVLITDAVLKKEFTFNPA